MVFISYCTAVLCFYTRADIDNVVAVHIFSYKVVKQNLPIKQRTSTTIVRVL